MRDDQLGKSMSSGKDGFVMSGGDGREGPEKGV